MSTEDAGGRLWPTSSLVLATLAILGAGVAESRLRSSRPDVPVDSVDEEGRGQHVRARLWQDPLAVVRAHLKSVGHVDVVNSADDAAQSDQAHDDHSTDPDSGPGPEPGDPGTTEGRGTVGDAVHLESGPGSAHARSGLDPHILGGLQHQLHDRGMQVKDLPSRDDENGVHTEYGAPLIMAALVPGSNFVEDSEERRRARFAVISGLLVEDFVPESAGYLGVVEHEFDPDLAQGPSSIAIPYEWFRHAARDPEFDERSADDDLEEHGQPSGKSAEEHARELLPRDVLVLWIDEAALPPTKPLAGILGIFDALTQTEKQPGTVAVPIEASAPRNHDHSGDPTALYRRAILGPSNSDLLKAMVSEACALGEAAETELLADLASMDMPLLEGWIPAGVDRSHLPPETKLFSTRASAPERTILEGLSNGGATIAEMLADPLNIKFQSTICSDELLVQELIEEFARREIGNGGFEEDDIVVLLTESDTLYGRNFEGLLERGFATHSKKQGTQSPEVRAFSYFRGLDGHAANSNHSRAPNEDMGQSFGRVQYDYARNLARRLKNVERDLHPEREGSIVAIGVLGSDLYDKQILLQAIQAQFPSALRFTTDLDARLLHPDQYPWSRNLLIASGYGFELEHDLQGSTPPFRDGYQTSAFLATRLAIPGHGIEFKDGTRGLAPGQLDPRIFEIGRSGAYDLSPVGEGHSLHPDRSKTLPSFANWALLAVIFMTLGALLWPMMRSIAYGLGGLWREGLVSDRDRWAPPATPRQALRRAFLRHWPWLLVLVPTLLLLYGIGRADAKGVGEPFELVEGVSVWPTIVVRGVAIFVAALLLRRSHVMMTRNMRKIAQNFALPEPVRGAAPGTPAALTIHGWSARNKHRYDSEEGTRQLNPAGRLWSEYLALSAPLRRGARIALNVFLAYVVYLLLTTAFGSPASPARGSIALGLDATTRHLAFLSMATLVFFVADATRLGEVLIRSLSIQRTEWPAGAWCPFGRSDGKLGATDEMGVVRDVQVIARHSEALGKLLLYPFAVLMLLILARNDFFDHWYWGLRDTLSYGLLATYALASTVLLRRSSEEARGRALKFLRGRLMRAEGDADAAQAAATGSSVAEGRDTGSDGQPTPPRDQTPFSTRQLELLIDDIRSMARGAFAPLSEHPIVRAAILPFTGLGLTSLLDLMATLNT